MLVFNNLSLGFQLLLSLQFWCKVKLHLFSGLNRYTVHTPDDMCCRNRERKEWKYLKKILSHCDTVQHKTLIMCTRSHHWPSLWEADHCPSYSHDLSYILGYFWLSITDMIDRFNAVRIFKIYMSIPVAVHSKAWVCGRLVVGIVGSNPAGDMDVSLWALCVVRWGSDWTFVQSSPTECGVSNDFDHEIP